MGAPRPSGASPRGGGLGRPGEESLWRIVRTTLLEAAPRFRRLIALFLASGLGAVVIELSVDLAGGADSWQLMGIPSVVLGSLGAVLLGGAYLLEAASQGDACGHALSLRVEMQTLHRMLLASPVLFAASALSSGAAVGILLTRGVLHSPVLLLAAAIYLWLGTLAVRKVRETGGFLYHHASEQAEAAARSRTEAAEARLAALQAQVHPHFLFNALNTVAALVGTDAAAAERTVENLAGVLRRTLDRSRQTFGSLAEEVEYLESYLAIEQERRRERLRVIWEIAPEALPLEIPTLTLQPLVENALKHGLGERIEGGTLTVAAAVAGGELRLTVSDDGPGFPQRLREGTGLANLRRRLAALYGDAARLEVGRRRTEEERGYGPPGDVPAAAGAADAGRAGHGPAGGAGDRPPGARAAVVLPARRRGAPGAAVAGAAGPAAARG